MNAKSDLAVFSKAGMLEVKVFLAVYNEDSPHLIKYKELYFLNGWWVGFGDGDSDRVSAGNFCPIPSLPLVRRQSY